VGSGARVVAAHVVSIVAGILIATGGVDAECMRGVVPANAPVALIFSGGGAKGAWEAGVAAALVESGVPIAVAAGSSAGALNATLLADGRLDRLEATWRSLTRDDVYTLRPGTFFSGLLPGWLGALALGSLDSLLDPSPLRARLAASIDFDRVRASRVRLVVVATDVVQRAARVFDNAALTVDALLGAAALPGLFPTVETGGAFLLDGGIIARAPVLEALAGPSPARALVLVSYATAERGRPPTSVRRAIEEAFETAMLHQIRRDTELAQLRHRDVDVQSVSPSAPLDLRPLDFEPGGLGRAFDLGRRDGRACADQLGITDLPR
jgi:NTE family protein